MIMRAETTKSTAATSAVGHIHSANMLGAKTMTGPRRPKRDAADIGRHTGRHPAALPAGSSQGGQEARNQVARIVFRCQGEDTAE